jgi:argininosuccinate lyase
MSSKTIKPKSGHKRDIDATTNFVEGFTASISFDKRLYQCDITASIAHVRMLAHVGVLSQAECKTIVSGLEAIQGAIEGGAFTWSRALEDVHMNIESQLIERIGAVGKKLHTGRSRNDQVATDIRLYLRDEIDAINRLLQRVMQALLKLARREVETIMPGFTHLQAAQPVTFGHHMMAWFEMLFRDAERLLACRRRVNVMPLGAAALAGTSYPIDRAYTAQLLGFEAITENSLDAVSDRDFAIEFSACAALIMVHLSRFSEELVLWASQQFNFIELDEAFCTGSSIMPQKKNPDVPELVRGKTGRVYGHLMALLTLMKGQALAYNRDNQEDKEPLFDTADTVQACLQAYAEMLPTLRVNREQLREAASRGLATATDMADYLVRKGVPFRDAHTIVGKVVRYALDEGKDLSEFTLEQLQTFSERFGEDVFNILRLDGAVAARDHLGGTAPSQVRAAIRRAEKRLAAQTRG